MKPMVEPILRIQIYIHFDLEPNYDGSKIKNKIGNKYN